MELSQRLVKHFQSNRRFIWPTDIADYALCPWKVYYRRVLGIYLEATGPLAIGWFEHEARRRFYNSLKGLPSVADLSSTEIDFLVTRCVVEALDWALLDFQSFPHSLRSYASQLRPSLIEEALKLVNAIRSDPRSEEKLIPFQVEATYTDTQMGVRGRIDLVYKCRKGYVPWDIKTGEPSTECLDAYILQVSTYALLIEQFYRSRVTMGGIRFTTQGREHVFQITSELRLKVLEIVSAIRQMFQTRRRPTVKRLTLPHCKNCGFLSFCEDAIGRTLKEVENQ